MNNHTILKTGAAGGLILLLNEFGYYFVEHDEVYVEIFELVENFKKHQ